jgi:hypothetical protein
MEKNGVNGVNEKISISLLVCELILDIMVDQDDAIYPAATLPIGGTMMGHQQQQQFNECVTRVSEAIYRFQDIGRWRTINVVIAEFIVGLFVMPKWFFEHGSRDAKTAARVFAFIGADALRSAMSRLSCNAIPPTGVGDLVQKLCLEEKQMILEQTDGSQEGEKEQFIYTSENGVFARGIKATIPCCVECCRYAANSENSAIAETVYVHCRVPGAWYSVDFTQGFGGEQQQQHTFKWAVDPNNCSSLTVCRHD